MATAAMLSAFRLSAVLALAAAMGCGDDGNTEPATGAVEITTATTGEAGIEYTVLMDGASPRTISPNGSLTISAVMTGTHIVQLTIPDGCLIEGDNPRTITVTSGATVTVAFTVTCGQA